LTDYGFSGYPLRKDFPIAGFVDVLFDDASESIMYRSTELPQEFRSQKFSDFE
jgi:NADH-quinone oxidoreductase subunit C